LQQKPNIILVNNLRTKIYLTQLSNSIMTLCQAKSNVVTKKNKSRVIQEKIVTENIYDKKHDHVSSNVMGVVRHKSARVRKANSRMRDFVMH